jgi:hypothetical protein
MHVRYYIIFVFGIQRHEVGRKVYFFEGQEVTGQPRRTGVASGRRDVGVGICGTVAVVEIG